ncbi:uncharacterized protein N7479_011453 [Penicillium vulpinum]|uniref:Cyanovirin-N domain-containing protein n=1 Tax=Penicillium vulpinum TaxID=29845 RepID=A0A1V6RXE0_9EURO|nr:uncharacterized protein N7479_011453 [Penicillium vulpinum]KAJ5953040.1 hypothetical protein N7479_011453 [Penicillium vulpinum]OQE06435.1 hypothetical protein PENVUL_c018G04129 [Penicillium vulpinum]
MLTHTVFASLFLLASAQLSKRSIFIEEVTDCSVLPSYNNDTKIAGPWTLKVDNCYNGTAIRGLCSIEGFESGSDITQERENRQNTTLEHGFVTTISDKDNIKTPFRCNGALNTIEAYVLSGPFPGALDWHTVGIEHHPSTGRLVWGKRSAEPVQAYRHFHRGIPVEGLFLGSNNETNWSLHSSGREVSITDMKPYWVMRLMIPETSIRENEFRALIHIDGS